jgi:hypothetical protein
MNPELAWMVAIFWIGRKPRCIDGFGIPDCSSDVRGSHLATTYVRSNVEGSSDGTNVVKMVGTA